uniref:Uncharacterized protein n=1 Tax=uncultured bacterium contig00063 TaxID=1181546 RepID=A0A806KNX9_9BACT|nr:hypothetical protein [uncultured bacterium contig00063]
MNAGTAGTVTFPVTTTNITNGNYPVSVANRPAGVSVQGQVAISGNAGTLTLAGDTSTVQGATGTLTLTIDGATSPAFTLTIAAAVPQTGTTTITYDWNDTINDDTIVSIADDILFTPTGGTFTRVLINGQIAAVNVDSYTFSKVGRGAGNYTITFVVKTGDNAYNKNITVTVAE